jgi:hypothetical protein
MSVDDAHDWVTTELVTHRVILWNVNDAEEIMTVDPKDLSDWF